MTTVTVLVALALAINAAGERDRLGHDRYVRAAAAGLARGQAVLARRYLSERRLQTARLAVIARPRVVVFGSSRVQPLSTTVAGLAPGQFYNAGMAGASVEDAIAAWATLVDAGNVPEVAVFSIDAWVFNRALAQEEWQEVAPAVERFLALAGAGRGVLRRWLDEAVYQWHQAKQFLSWPVLRASMTALAPGIDREWRADDDVARALGAVVAEDQVGNRRAFRADGSVMNDLPTLRDDQLAAVAIDYVVALRARLADFQLDVERGRRLGLLWQAMRERGVRVVAYLPPYHPITWARMRGDRRYAVPLARTARFLTDIAAASGARFVDLSDPSAVPCAANEFFDGDHPREPCLARIVAFLRLAPVTSPAAPPTRAITWSRRSE
ncbi:MAG TPA: hypothetical protein VGU22_16290 [Methylomirabilota bacterium]|nr:hypothetical protein [Methylomirabilota bacterium]